jgi:undecaprenyl-diphosphatase
VQLIQAIILGLVQGLTEFIPVSSSGHLIVVGHFLHFQYSGLAFDTALDIGTLAALYLFFWKDFVRMAVAVVGNKPGDDRRLGWLIVLGTIPAVVLGLLLEKPIDSIFHTGPHATTFVAINLIWVAIVMLIVDRLGRLQRKLKDVDTRDAGVIGFAQALALIPGVSRSGITISAGRALGFDRVSITRFSFLLSAPVITAATAKEVLKGTTLHEMSVVPLVYLLGILAAFISGYWAIKFLISYLGKHGLAAFAYYRLVVGFLILVALR